MKKNSIILMILLAAIAAVSLFQCGSGTDDILVTHRLNGGWIINPDTGNDKNFIVIERGSLTHHGFRAEAAELLSSTEDGFLLSFTNGIATTLINATMATSETATYIMSPGSVTGTISRVPDIKACSRMSTSWWVYMTPDGGASSPSFKPTRHAFNGISFSLSFDIDSDGTVTGSGAGNFDVTGGRMICNGTSMDDLMVGLMATNAAASPYPEYNTIKLVGIKNGIGLISGLYNSESAFPWPLGTFEMMAPPSP